MKKQGSGAIVNDSSLAGVNAMGSSIAYVTSKAALNAMTKSLAHVLGPEIRINAVAPGPIKTRWLKGGMSDEAYDSLIEQAEKSLPLRKGCICRRRCRGSCLVFGRCALDYWGNLNH